MAHDVFISYSFDDQKIVDGLSAYLEQNGIRCFVAYRDIPRGKNWAEYIPPAIENCKMMVYVHSVTANESEMINKEIALCLEYKRPILPFKISDIKYKGAKAFHLVTINWIDAFPDPKEYFGELLNSIKNLFPELEIEINTRKEEQDRLENERVEKERMNQEALAKREREERERKERLQEKWGQQEGTERQPKGYKFSWNIYSILSGALVVFVFMMIRVCNETSRPLQDSGFRQKIIRDENEDLKKENKELYKKLEQTEEYKQARELEILKQRDNYETQQEE